MSEDVKKEKEKKDIEDIYGDGKNIDISPVYEHLQSSKPKATKDKPKNIVVPKTKK